MTLISYLSYPTNEPNVDFSLGSYFLIIMGKMVDFNRKHIKFTLAGICGKAEKKTPSKG